MVRLYGLGVFIPAECGDTAGVRDTQAELGAPDDLE